MLGRLGCVSELSAATSNLEKASVFIRIAGSPILVSENHRVCLKKRHVLREFSCRARHHRPNNVYIRNN